LTCKAAEITEHVELVERARALPTYVRQAVYGVMEGVMVSLRALAPIAEEAGQEEEEEEEESQGAEGPVGQ